MVPLAADAVFRIANGSASNDYWRHGARRGFAGDHVRAMWLMLQQDQPDHCVVASGEEHSVREFVDLAFRYADLVRIRREVAKKSREAS